MSIVYWTKDLRNQSHSFDDQPALVYFDGSRSWWWHGYRHRETGPAWCGVLGECSWALFGVTISRRVHRRLVELPARWRRRHALRMRPHWLCALDAHLIADVARLVVDTFLIP